MSTKPATFKRLAERLNGIREIFDARSTRIVVVIALGTKLMVIVCVVVVPIVMRTVA
jgi:hypothetical protein